MDKIGAIKATSINLRDLIVDSIPASVTASMVDCNMLIQPVSDQLKGRYFYIYEGAGNGQERVVTSFTPASNRLGFDQVFSPVPSINSKFILTDFFRKTEYDGALDRMLGISRTKFLEDRVATLQIVGSQYEYLVPSGIDYISLLRCVPSTGSDYDSIDETSLIFEIAPRYWRIEPNPLGSFVLAFDARKIDLSQWDEDWLRIMGQSRTNIAATDNASIPTKLEEFIVAGMSMLMASQRIDENKEWQSKFYMFRDMYRDLEQYVFTHRRGKPVGMPV